MANITSEVSRTIAATPATYTSPFSMLTAGSNVTSSTSFTPMKPPRLRGSRTRRVNSAMSMSGISPLDSPENTLPRTSFQAYAQSRMRLNNANDPHQKRSHAISSSHPLFNESGESSNRSRNYHIRPRPGEVLEEYNSVHLGPKITISSADGAGVWLEAHADDGMKDMAALTLYQAIEAQQNEMNQVILDDHLKITIGAIDIEVQKKSVAARRRVHFAQAPEIRPQHAVLEGVDEEVAQGDTTVLQRVSHRVKRRVSAWCGKLV